MEIAFLGQKVNIDIEKVTQPAREPDQTVFLEYAGPGIGFVEQAQGGYYLSPDQIGKIKEGGEINSFSIGARRTKDGKYLVTLAAKQD